MVFMSTLSSKTYTRLLKVRDNLIAYNKINLSEKRFNHISGVSKMLIHFAGRFKMNALEAEIASHGHDLAREFSDEKLLKQVQNAGFKISTEQRERPILLHGRAAMILLKDRFKCYSGDVLSAVEHHTLGCEDWCDLGKLLFVADYAEPGRKYIKSDFIKRLDYLNINEMVIAVCEHAERRGKKMHSITRKMYLECKGSMYETG